MNNQDSIIVFINEIMTLLFVLKSELKFIYYFPLIV